MLLLLLPVLVQRGKLTNTEFGRQQNKRTGSIHASNKSRTRDTEHVSHVGKMVVAKPYVSMRVFYRAKLAMRVDGF